MGAQPKSQQSVTTVLLALEEDIVLGRLYPRERLVEEQLALPSALSAMWCGKF